MGNNSYDIIVKVVAVGIPALLIVLGFVAFMAGSTVQMLGGNPEIKNLGIILLIIGISIALIELAVWIYGELS